jgi:hypothetical protein
VFAIAKGMIFGCSLCYSITRAWKPDLAALYLRKTDFIRNLSKRRFMREIFPKAPSVRDVTNPYDLGLKCRAIAAASPAFGGIRILELA